MTRSVKARMLIRCVGVIEGMKEISNRARGLGWTAPSVSRSTMGLINCFSTVVTLSSEGLLLAIVSKDAKKR